MSHGNTARLRTAVDSEMQDLPVGNNFVSSTAQPFTCECVKSLEKHGSRRDKFIVHQCIVCRRAEGGPFASPPMPPLPAERVNQSPAFTFCGVDYFGPMFVKVEAGENKKVWVLLFTCLATRAIHLELVADMSTEQFLLAFRRFVARRGCPSRIWSDNAPQFKHADKTLH